MPWFCLPRGFFRKSKEAQSQAEAHCITLPFLPRDVIEIICQPLDLRDRIALTSCCRALWERSDVACSDVLWEHLNLGQWDVCSERKARSLAAWLARRNGGLGQLRLHLNTPYYRLEGLWIQHWGEPRWDRGMRPLLSLLPCVPALRSLELRGLGLRQLPPQLAACTALEELSLRGNGCMGREGEGAFQVLQHLTVLTRLSLRSCGLKTLPPQLSALVALANLNVSGNGGLGEVGPAAIQPLRHLHSLTRLDLGECHLQRIPGLLWTLPSLADLSFSFDPPLGKEEAPGALRALHGIAALTRLNLGGCGVDARVVRALIGQRVQLTCW